MAAQEAEVSPLRALGQLLRAGLPHLGALLGWLGSYEDYNDFVTLIREFLPEHEAEILRAGGPTAQIVAFASRFETRYFPLSGRVRDGMAEEYNELTSWIMVDTFGIEWDDYYEPDCFNPGYQLMSYLVQSDEEGRAPLAEVCARYVPASLLERAGDGFSPEELRRLLAGTRFEALADWADIWCHSTGLYFLDATSEDIWNDCIDWSREHVESLTADWQRSELIINRMRELANWLEEDPPHHFAELLEFIEQRNGNAQGT